MKCDYGCGQEAKHQFKNGKWCCSDNVSKCPNIINKISNNDDIVLCKKCGQSFTKHGLKYHLHFCKGKKYCKCGKEIHPSRKYCSIKCSNIYSRKTPKIVKYCLFCGKEISQYNTYCNNTCKAEYKSQQLIEQWLNGDIDGCSKHGHANYVKKYLLQKYDNKCSKCGWGEINPYTKTIPLEVEHIDGNSFNNDPENVTILCPNCHSLTKTYRGANRGNGRRAYLKEYYIKDENGKIISG